MLFIGDVVGPLQWSAIPDHHQTYAIQINYLRYLQNGRCEVLPNARSLETMTSQEDWIYVPPDGALASQCNVSPPAML